MIEYILSFHKKTSIECDVSGKSIIRCDRFKFEVARNSEAALSIFKDFQVAGLSTEKMLFKLNGFHGSDVKLKVKEFSELINAFARAGWLEYSLSYNKKTSLKLFPKIGGNLLDFECEGVPNLFQLGRFSYARVVDGRYVMESPFSNFLIYLPGDLSWDFLAFLSQPRNLKQVADKFENIEEHLLIVIIGVLVKNGFIDSISESSDAISEDSTQYWGFHELLCQTGSRLGFSSSPIGGTYRFLGKIDPEPAFKTMSTPLNIKLFIPDIEQLKLHDRPFTEISEKRKSIRNFGSKSINVKDLGEFLFRSARVRSVISDFKEDLSSRPYPSGGSNYELELYVIVNQCENLEKGIYHYNSGNHYLSKIDGLNSGSKEILRDATQSIGSIPQILIVITSRIKKIAWKYENIGYQLSLKNSGALTHQMGLVATSMSLASCAVGAANTKAFEKASGIFWVDEPSIAEIALGSIAK